MSAEGHVEAIYIGPVEAGLLVEVPEVEAVAGHGLKGDRYYFDTKQDEPGREITLVEAEAIEALAAEHGIELCEPCSHLQSLTQPGVMRGLAHRGGLRADILNGGTIRPGDPVREVPDRAEAPAT